MTAQAELQPTRPEAQFIRTFPCGGCGAKLSFAPGTTQLRCEYCGTANEIEAGDGRVEELDFGTFLQSLASHEESVDTELVKCPKCGAEQGLPDHHFAAHCAFCRAPIASAGYASRLLKPKAIIPFQVDRTAAQEAFRRWVRKLWLAPGDLKRYAQSDAGLDGVYLPFWTYDCDTTTDYRGERGDDYYTTETYVAQEGGKSVTRTRQVRHTRWSPASGRVAHFHDDVLVMASGSLPSHLLGSAAKWRLEALQPYQAEFVTGFRAEAYQVGLREGFPVAKQAIDAKVESLVREDIGGDQQRIHHADTQYSQVKFKHVLLPLWISAYRYRDRTYRFVINGQTGEVCGENPTSWWKVAGLVALALFILLLLAMFSE